MKKRKLFEGTWEAYYKELNKHVTKKVIEEKFSHFEESFKLGAMPKKAIEWL